VREKCRGLYEGAAHVEMVASGCCVLLLKPDSADIWTDAGLLSFELLCGDCAIVPAAMSRPTAGKIWHDLRLRLVAETADCYRGVSPASAAPYVGTRPCPCSREEPTVCEPES
jgi:hypothetical protein